MQFKISSQWSFLIVGITGILFSLIIIFFPINDKLIKSNQASIQAITFTEQASTGLPVRLKIPKINVDAVVEYVGLTSEGAMDVPKGPMEVAWFSLGPRPGEQGSSVIAGHSGYKDNIPAVFDNLHKLKKGDRIYVEDGNGTITTFVVRESRRYDPEADASNVFDLNDGNVHLNLITCIGIWNETAKSRSERLIVFTDKEIK